MPSLSMPETATAAAPAEDEQLAPGATAIVEAATAEAAIAEVHATHGPGAQIVEARRVLRGGFGGFFSKEHVQLHVAAMPEEDHLARRRPAAREPSSRRDGATAQRDPEPAGDVTARATALIAELTGSSAPSEPESGAGDSAGSPVDRLLAADGQDGDGSNEPEGDEPDRVVDLDADQVDFGTYLRAQLAAEREAVFGSGTVATPSATSTTPAIAVNCPSTPIIARAPVILERSLYSGDSSAPQA